MKQGNLCSHRKREYTDTENEEKLTANSSIGWRERERECFAARDKYKDKESGNLLEQVRMRETRLHPLCLLLFEMWAFMGLSLSRANYSYWVGL